MPTCYAGLSIRLAFVHDFFGSATGQIQWCRFAGSTLPYKAITFQVSLSLSSNVEEFLKQPAPEEKYRIVISALEGFFRYEIFISLVYGNDFQIPSGGSCNSSTPSRDIKISPTPRLGDFVGREDT